MLGLIGLGAQELLCLGFMGVMIVGTVVLVVFLTKKKSGPRTPEERDFDDQ